MISSVEGISLEDIYDCTLFSYDDHMIVYLARILLCLLGGTISSYNWSGVQSMILVPNIDTAVTHFP